ncbi:MAG: NHL repeat-containing protein [Nitrospirota bacterium]|nr:NHL repeat-containing protein [Nitrospirota bacterium]
MLVLLFLLVSLEPFKAYAEEPVTGVTYFDSITEDEEGFRIYYPMNVFWEPVKEELYILVGGSRMLIYSADFFPLFTIDKKKGIGSPSGLAVDTDGNLYVSQGSSAGNTRARISVFNARLIFERDIYPEGFEGDDSFVPGSLSLDKKGNLLVTGSPLGVLYMDKQGRFIDMISPEEKGEKVRVTNAAVGKDGTIYLLSDEESRVYVYDSERKFLFEFGEKGGSSGKLSRPSGVAVDDDNGLIYVSDYMRHTVNAYDKSGKFAFEFGGIGWSAGWFQYPSAICIDGEGKVLVADLFNHRVQVFKPNK